ncbi:MAG: hypothetical protein QG622_780 [Actinomycetota bacterium]|nr:hypothetical protein [Actinomycetota bacterium]
MEGRPGRRSDPGAAAYRTTVQRWFDVTIGPGPLTEPPGSSGAADRGSLASVVRRMADLARHDARWARLTPSVLAGTAVGVILAVLLDRYPPVVAVLVTAAALACPLTILPVASWLPAAVRRVAAVGRRPVSGRPRASLACSLLIAVLATATHTVGRELAAPSGQPAGDLSVVFLPGMTGPVTPLTPSRGIGAGLALGAVLALGFVALGVLLDLAGAVVRRSRERADPVVAVAAPAVEALHLLPQDTSPLDPEDKAAVLAPLRRLARNLEVTLPRLLPVSGRREQRDLTEFSVRAGRAVRSWEPLVVASNPDRVHTLRVNLEAVLAATLNGDYADLPIARDSGSGLRRSAWRPFVLRSVTISTPLILGGVALAVSASGRWGTLPAAAVGAVEAFARFWIVLGLLMTLDALA